MTEDYETMRLLRIRHMNENLRQIFLELIRWWRLVSVFSFKFHFIPQKTYEKLISNIQI